MRCNSRAWLLTGICPGLSATDFDCRRCSGRQPEPVADRSCSGSSGPFHPWGQDFRTWDNWRAHEHPPDWDVVPSFATQAACPRLPEGWGDIARRVDRESRIRRCAGCPAVGDGDTEEPGAMALGGHQRRARSPAAAGAGSGVPAVSPPRWATAARGRPGCPGAATRVRGLPGSDRDRSPEVWVEESGRRDCRCGG